MIRAIVSSAWFLARNFAAGFAHGLAGVETWLVVAVFGILSGCAHERVVVEPVEVRVPVPVPCVVQLPADPERPTQKEPPAADVFEAMRRALAEIELWKGWAVQAKAATRGCELRGGKP